MPELKFDTYYPYDALTEILQSLAEAHPTLLSLESIGTSYEGRDVWCITATNQETGSAEDKPAFWCDGNIHATEVSASSACLHLIHRLVTGYGKIAVVTRAMDTRAFYIVPRVNPDGAELYFANPPRYIRSSTRPYPYDEEPIEGLKPQDIDGDGRILSMRMKDPNGSWKIHPEHPRLMLKRDPTEVGGTYFRVMQEGLLENYDGFTFSVQKNKEGLDLNRNFPAHWRSEKEQAGAGPFPGSEPEAYNLIQFISQHPNITGAITFHTFSGALLRPYGTESDDTMPAEDLWVFEEQGKRGSELTGYPAISVFHDFRYHPREVITGVFDDWCYESMGIFAWTVEIWSPHRQSGILEGFTPDTKKGAHRFTTWGRNHTLEEDIKLMEWSDSNLDGKGYVAWTHFHHPQLGDVEIGGWDVQLAFRNPPPAYLEREIAPLTEWALWCCLISPKLEVQTCTAEHLSEGVYLLRIVANNSGWLPSYVSKKALERGVCRPVVAEIDLPEGCSLLQGKRRMEIGQLEGRAYKSASPSYGGSDPTNERCKVEWVVSGSEGMQIELTLKHARAGTVRRQVTLPPAS